MTREERTKLIKHLKYNRSIGADYLITDNDADEIIKALEQEPCEDCISRQAALSMQYRIDDSVTLSTRDVVNVDDIEDLPPVKPQPKTGYWIRGHFGFGCSNCHKAIEGEWDDNIDDITGTLLCPNCGAIMIELKESEKINCKATKCESCINHNCCDYELQERSDKK